MDFIKDPQTFKNLNGYEIDGVWYPRVTKIIENKAKPALYRYYAEALNYKTAMESTQKSAEEGTLIHEITQKIMIGEKPEIPEYVSPAINAASEFLERNNIQIDPDYIEKRLINYDKKYAGTIDALALIDGKFGVLDIKTSQAIYRDYNLQTAAYMEPLAKEVKNLQTRWIFRIDQIKKCLRCGATLRTKGGRDKIRKNWNGNGFNGASACPEDSHSWGELKGVIELQEFPFWQHDFEAFLSAKKLWEWENYSWLKKIGYLS